MQVAPECGQPDMDFVQVLLRDGVDLFDRVLNGPFDILEQKSLQIGYRDRPARRVDLRIPDCFRDFSLAGVKRIGVRQGQPAHRRQQQAKRRSQPFPVAGVDGSCLCRIRTFGLERDQGYRQVATING